MKALELLNHYDAYLENEKEMAIQKEDLKQLIIEKQNEISRLIYEKIIKFIGVSINVQVITTFITKKPHISIADYSFKLYYHDYDIIIENNENSISYNLITNIKEVIDNELILENI
jgi:hypothetical protein